MNSIKLFESIVINKPNDVVFDYTQNYKNRPTWDTFLKQAELINGATKADKGVRAWCVAKMD